MVQAVDRFRPRAVVLCFGAEAATYRTAAWPGYHADRPPMPDDLVPQWEAAPAFFAAFGWAGEHAGDLEADDLLGTLATLETDAGGRAVLFTGDRDMFQCVTDRSACSPRRQGGADRDGPRAVRAKYGIEPEQVPDFIALRGDPSDGLPGAKGIGEKTAAELLRAHGSSTRCSNWPRRRWQRGARPEAACHRGTHRTGRGAPLLPRYRHVATDPRGRPDDTPTRWADAAAPPEIVGWAASQSGWPR